MTVGSYTNDYMYDVHTVYYGFSAKEFEDTYIGGTIPPFGSIEPNYTFFIERETQKLSSFPITGLFSFYLDEWLGGSYSYIESVFSIQSDKLITLGKENSSGSQDPYYIGRMDTGNYYTTESQDTDHPVVANINWEFTADDVGKTIPIYMGYKQPEK